jgi:hypothetical protein
MYAHSSDVMVTSTVISGRRGFSTANTMALTAIASSTFQPLQ